MSAEYDTGRRPHLTARAAIEDRVDTGHWGRAECECLDWKPSRSCGV